MPTNVPRGTETYTPMFDVEPSYATGSDEVFLFLRLDDGPERVYTLSRDEASRLKSALDRVLPCDDFVRQM